MGLLTPHERDAFAESTLRLGANALGFGDKLYIPAQVSPNLLSLCSALCLVAAWYLHELLFPAFALVLLSFLLDEIAKWQALRIGNKDNFVILVRDICANVGGIFLAMSCAMLASNSNASIIWYVVQIRQMVALSKQIDALQTGRREYNPLSLLWGTIALSLLFALYLLHFFVPSLPPALVIAFDLSQRVLLFQHAMELDGANLLLLPCLLMLSLPRLYQVIGAWYFTDEQRGMSQMQIVADALAMSVVSCEVLMCRIARTHNVHATILLLCLTSVFAPAELAIGLSALYYLVLVCELTQHLNLSLFFAPTNVYVDGIFDMLHMGHLKHFARAAQLGTRLYVGVVNDEDATPYKRKPIMTSQERCEMVATSKSVFGVIPNAPCVKGGLNEAFLQRHNIHIVACGEEYDREEDEWYAVPRRLGMLRVLPRTAEVSTSDIIQRILNRQQQQQ